MPKKYLAFYVLGVMLLALCGWCLSLNRQVNISQEDFDYERLRVGDYQLKIEGQTFELSFPSAYQEKVLWTLGETSPDLTIEEGPAYLSLSSQDLYKREGTILIWRGELTTKAAGTYQATFLKQENFSDNSPQTAYVLTLTSDGKTITASSLTQRAIDD